MCRGRVLRNLEVTLIAGEVLHPGAGSRVDDVLEVSSEAEGKPDAR